MIPLSLKERKGKDECRNPYFVNKRVLFNVFFILALRNKIIQTEGSRSR